MPSLLKAASMPPAKPRLASGRADIWGAQERLGIVRELYDGYAADPFGAAMPPATKVTAEVIKKPPSKKEGQWSERRGQFLERYLERQAAIEGLLEDKWRRATEAPPAPCKVLAAPMRTQNDSVDSLQEATVNSAGNTSDKTPVTIQRRQLFRLASKTPNVVLDDDVLSTERWSGGVLFMPPHANTFLLTICPLDPIYANPFFIGIVPSNVDLTAVNLFDLNGIFVCMGGMQSEELIGALGAPSGPSYHVFGQRTLADDLPSLAPGQTLSVEYTEVEGETVSTAEGTVRFIVGDERGRGIYEARPRLPGPIRAGGDWRPCVLLCVPGSRFRVLWCS